MTNVLTKIITGVGKAIVETLTLGISKPTHASADSFPATRALTMRTLENSASKNSCTLIPSALYTVAGGGSSVGWNGNERVHMC